MEKLLYAFPIFALLLLMEFGYGLYKKRNTYADIKDAVASLTLGILHAGMLVLTASLLLKIDFFLYEKRIFTFENTWHVVIIMLLLTDFTYYWWHRISHRVRILWANHVNHHSSTRFNFTTAFRQPFFTPVLRPLSYFYLPFLGFDPQMLAIFGHCRIGLGSLVPYPTYRKTGFFWSTSLSPPLPIGCIMAPILST